MGIGPSNTQGSRLSFTGSYRHTIDAKGRLIVPARMRDELGDNVVLSTWLDGCIALWSQAGWEEIEALLRRQPNNSRAARAFVRKVAKSAHSEEVDRQGRITVSGALRSEAGITRDVVVNGAINRAELWSPERWDEQEQQVEEGSLEALADQLDF